MKQNRELKWVYEIIAENIPLISLLPRKYNVLAQLIFIETIGILLALHFKVSINAFIAGSLSIFIVILWSLMTLEIAPKLRNCKVPFSEAENRFMDRYKKELFHEKHLEMIPGIFVFLLLISYVFYFHGSFNSPNLIEYYLGGEVNAILTVFIIFLFWDISYRVGLGLWISGLALWRSFKAKEIAEKRIGLEYAPYSTLNNLRKLDINNYAFGLVSLLFLPIVFPDKILVYSLIIYASSIWIMSFASLHFISQIPWLPPDILELVNEGRFAYIGTSSRKTMPHVTPVIYVFSEGSLYFVTSRVSKKLKNLRENERAAFLIDLRDPNDIYKNKALLISGKVKIYTVLDAFLRFPSMYKAGRLFYEKYPGYMTRYSDEKKNLPRAWQTTPIISRILVKIKPEDVFYWREARQIKIPV